MPPCSNKENMKTKAVRLYGKEDLRLEEFELPAITADEILAKVVSDSICMSSYKAAKQATDHKRIPQDIAECQHDRELIRDGLMLTAAGDRYLYMLDVVEGVYKAQERPTTAFELAGGNL